MIRGILMKYPMRSTTYIFFILIAFAMFFIGCTVDITPTIVPTITVGPTSGTISIEGGADTTFDCTPELTIYSEGAAYMSFSGDGENWSEWVEYNTTYEEFNITNNLSGTEFSAGLKYVYVRFKDENEKLSPPDNLAFDTINYEFKDLNSIKIIPSEITMTVGSSYTFEVKGYDIDSNEIPLDGSQIIWEKSCGVGSLSDTSGLAITYTAPTVTGDRDIMANCGPLRTGAKIMVINK
jgi:hypothetical protein